MENSGQGSASSAKSREDMETELQEARDSGNIVLRLQYLNDRVRYVHAPPNMPVALFKRCHFYPCFNPSPLLVSLTYQ